MHTPSTSDWAPRHTLGTLLLRIEAGKSPLTLDRPSRPDEYGVLKVSAVSWGEFRAEENKAIPPDFDVTGVPTIQAGDLILSRANTTELVGAVVLAKQDHPRLLLSDKTLRLTSNLEWVHPGYLLYALRSFEVRRHIEAHATGTSDSMRNISQANLCSARIPLPALPEQKRIAAILDKADAIRRMRRESVRVAEELLRSTFLEMFGDPVTNPKGWKVQPLGDVIEQLEAGWSANGDPRPATGTEFGVLKVSAVTSGYFRPEEHKAVSAALVDRELVTPRAGDLLFSRANTRELVGATCVVESDQPRLFLPDKIWRVVVRDGYATTPYLRFLLSHERFRCELTKTATGTSGSMLNVSMDKLKQLRAPIPPFSVQQRFSAFVWAALQSKARFAGAETDSNNLFDSLLDRAFRGELTSSETVPRQLSIFPVESRRS